ncbi:MAG: hypothetical protein M3545_16000 [Acidobacteriota bacterium]|nr:hypothetical protein [Acidobacteriota bacterium]
MSAERTCRNKLAHIEQRELAILAEIHGPVARADLDAIFYGDRPARWRKRTAARDKSRSNTAMMVLVLIEHLRELLEHPETPPWAAVSTALRIGLDARDSAADFETAVRTRRTAQQKGRARGAQVASTATAHDSAIERAVRQWTNSDDLQEDYGYRSPVAYVRHQTKLQTRAIQRAMKRLGLSSRQ